MALYEDWHKRAEAQENEEKQQKYWDEYFAKETENYRKILTDKTFAYSGTLSALAETFSMDPVTFTGFLDGINTSLETALDLDALTEETALSFKVLPEKLYYNMLGAKASWLYGLPEWDAILTEERRHEITKEFKSAGIFVKENTVGRNDPCPCGSGKKYKKCCGRQ